MLIVVTDNHNLHLYNSCCDNLLLYNMMHAAGLLGKHPTLKEKWQEKIKDFIMTANAKYLDKYSILFIIWNLALITLISV